MPDDCGACREAVSARFDGEDPGAPDAWIEAHLAGCEDCAVFERVIRHPSMQPALEDIPTASAMGWARRALLVVALLLGAVAIFSLVASTGDHAPGEVAGLELALAVGLATVALRPHRARALLPVALTIAGAVAWLLLIEVVGGGTPLLSEVHHSLELAGAVLVLVLARTIVSGPPILDP